MKNELWRIDRGKLEKGVPMTYGDGRTRKVFLFNIIATADVLATSNVLG